MMPNFAAQTTSIRMTEVLRFWIDGRCFLRLLEEADANELYAVVDDNREYLARWMPWAANTNLEATVEFIRDSRRKLADNQGFQVVIVEDVRIVGTMGFHHVDWENRSASIGGTGSRSPVRAGVSSRGRCAL